MICFKDLCIYKSFKKIFRFRNHEPTLDETLDSLNTIYTITNEDDSHYNNNNVKMRLLCNDDCLICLEELRKDSCIKIKWSSSIDKK